MFCRLIQFRTDQGYMYKHCVWRKRVNAVMIRFNKLFLKKSYHTSIILMFHKNRTDIPTNVFIHLLQFSFIQGKRLDIRDSLIVSLMF